MTSQLSDAFVMCAYLLSSPLQEGKGRVCRSSGNSWARQGEKYCHGGGMALSPVQKGNGSCLFEPKERMPTQVDLRLLAEKHPRTDHPAHTRPYLATNGQPEEIPLNWTPQVFLLLWKAPPTCSWQNSLQHFLVSPFPVWLFSSFLLPFCDLLPRLQTPQPLP